MKDCNFSLYKLMRDNFERYIHAQGENSMKTIKALQPKTNPPSAIRDARRAALFYFHFDKTSIIQGQYVIDLITSGVFSIANKPIAKSSSSASRQANTLL